MKPEGERGSGRRAGGGGGFLKQYVGGEGAPGRCKYCWRRGGAGIDPTSHPPEGGTAGATCLLPVVWGEVVVAGVACWRGSCRGWGW